MTFVSTAVRVLGWRSSVTASFVGGLGLQDGRKRHHADQQQRRQLFTGTRRVSLLVIGTNTSSSSRDRHHQEQQPSRAVHASRRSSSIHSTSDGNGSSGGKRLQSKNTVAAWPSTLSQAGSNSSGIGTSFAETVKQAAQWLEAHEVIDPEPSASELLAKAAGFRSPQEMLSHQQQIPRYPGEVGPSLEMSVAEWDEFRRLCVLRAAQHVPVQYLVGEWDFYGLSLEMKPPTLIPRPETEELVETILKWLRRDVMTVAGGGGGGSGGGGASALRFLDVGSGTGSIGLALLNELPVEARCVAVDAQESAVRLSRRNAERTGLQARYCCFHAEVAEFGTGLEPSGITDSSSSPATAAGAVAGEETGAVEQRVKDRAGQEGNNIAFEFDGSFDFIVSNPPYIPRRDMEALPRDVANHEDSVALDGGEDGLDVVRDIVRRCPRLLKRGGPRQLWMEVDTSHPEAIQRWLGLPVGLGGQGMDGGSQQCQAHGVTRFEWMRDMSQRPRFVRLTFAEEVEEES